MNRLLKNLKMLVLSVLLCSGIKAETVQLFLDDDQREVIIETLRAALENIQELYPNKNEEDRAALQEKMQYCCDQLIEYNDRSALLDLIELLPTIMSYLETKNIGSDSSLIDEAASEYRACSSSGIMATLNQILKILIECCKTLEDDFRATWTILDSLNFNLTATIDLDGVYTALAECCSEMQGSLGDLKGTLTACCTEIEKDLKSIFTVIDNITVKVDLNGVYTALDTCCADLHNTFTSCCEDLKSIFTVIENITVKVDLNGVYTVLDACCQDLNSTLTTCCADIKSIFTVIDNITVKVDLNGMYTALAECCAATNQTFTVLEDLNNTLTTCCADINGSLGDIKGTLTACCTEIEKDLKSIFTVLDNITVNVDLNGMYTALAECCNGGGGGSGFGCQSTITGPTTISTPGNYCLAHDIIGQITIAANHVTLDMNNRTLSSPGNIALIVRDATNVIVKNGCLTSSSTALAINSCNGVQLLNLIVDKNTQSALAISSSRGVIMDNCQIKDNTILGQYLILLDDCANCHLKNSYVYTNTIINTTQIKNVSIIQINNSNDNIVENVNISSNTYQTIILNVYQPNIITYINVVGGSFNTVKNNVLINNTVIGGAIKGIDFTKTNYGSVERNLISGDSPAGYYTWGNTGISIATYTLSSPVRVSSNTMCFGNKVVRANKTNSDNNYVGPSLVMEWDTALGLIAGSGTNYTSATEYYNISVTIPKPPATGEISTADNVLVGLNNKYMNKLDNGQQNFSAVFMDVES